MEKLITNAVNTIKGFAVGNTFFKARPLALYCLGKNFTMRRHVLGGIEEVQLDLSQYFIDEEGDLYSMNDETYVTHGGRNLVMLANSSVDDAGYLVNSLRDRNGRSVKGRGFKKTFRRIDLIAAMQSGKLEMVDYGSLAGAKPENQSLVG